MEIYNIKNVKKLSNIIAQFFEETIKSKGYTYPELIVSAHLAIDIIAFKKQNIKVNL